VGQTYGENMRTLLTALAATTLMAGSVAVVWKAEAAMMPGMASLPLTNSYSPVEKVRRCVCGTYGCACGQRYRRGYEYGPPALSAGLRIPASRLHVRHTRVSETLALPALAAWYAVLSLSQLTLSLPTTKARAV
jgi:hypothetical protein